MVYVSHLMLWNIYKRSFCYGKCPKSASGEQPAVGKNSLSSSQVSLFKSWYELVLIPVLQVKLALRNIAKFNFNLHITLGSKNSGLQ